MLTNEQYLTEKDIRSFVLLSNFIMDLLYYFVPLYWLRNQNSNSSSANTFLALGTGSPMAFNMLVMGKSTNVLI
jgi:hypothetical protein